ncbi:MAG: tail fiber domain-containing protein [Pirellulaceae bacterium]|nr:tail fiber domain-containing protein [Pirellulaceae bacterium]
MTSRITTSFSRTFRYPRWCSWLSAISLTLLMAGSVWAQGGNQGNGPKVFSAGTLQARDGILVLGRNLDSPCRIVAQPGEALRVLDPAGVRILNPVQPTASSVFWGPTNDCSISIDPDLPGLLLRDPRGIRVMNPRDELAARVLFGPTDDCSIGIDPELPGLVERDPIGFRLLGPNGQGCRLIFGPTMDCTIEVQPPGPNRVPGLLLRDPDGIRIIDPRGRLATLRFGAAGRCSISAAPELGMILDDPEGFLFTNDVIVNGNISANNFPQTSSRRFKENIRPVGDALERVQQLQGVYFDWKPERGGQADVGFIAEEVAQVLPQLVTWDERHEVVQGVKYANVVAIAIEGIKAQQDQIERLKTENASLRGRLQTLESQVSTLASRVQALAEAAEE